MRRTLKLQVLAGFFLIIFGVAIGFITYGIGFPWGAMIIISVGVYNVLDGIQETFKEAIKIFGG